MLPTPSRPRLLVPVGISGAATMLRRHSTSGRQRLAQRILVAGVKSRLLELFPLPRLIVDSSHSSGSDLREWLGELLGGHVRLGVLLGPPRANGKPVLQVFDAIGSTRAFVKIGHIPLTRELVIREGETLGRLAAAGLRRLAVPRVLAERDWNGLRILVLSPLASSQGRQRLVTPPPQAMCELAVALGTRQARLDDSPYIRRVHAATSLLPGPAGGQLRHALAMVIATYRRATVIFGSWHGDWAPWNMGVANGRAEVWDWERFDDDVPLGFDAVHYRVQQLRATDAPADAAIATLTAERDALLRPFGVPAATERAVLALYLIEVATRYATDLDVVPTTALRGRLTWMLDMLSMLLPDLGKESS